MIHKKQPTVICEITSEMPVLLTTTNPNDKVTHYISQALRFPLNAKGWDRIKVYADSSLSGELVSIQKIAHKALDFLLLLPKQESYLVF